MTKTRIEIKDTKIDKGRSGKKQNREGKSTDKNKQIKEERKKQCKEYTESMTKIKNENKRY